MFVVVAPSLLATVNAGALEIVAIEDVKTNTEKNHPDGFLIVARKRKESEPVARGQDLIREIFFGKIKSDDDLERALVDATPDMRSRVKTMLSLKDSLSSALTTTQKHKISLKF